MTANKRRLVYEWRDAIRSSELKPTLRAVARAMTDYMDTDTGEHAFAGPARLAKDTGLSVKTIKRARAELVELGWLRLVRRGGTTRDGTRSSNEYAASFPRPQDSLTGGQGDPGDMRSSPGGQRVQSRGSESPTTPFSTPTTTPAGAREADGTETLYADRDCPLCQGRGSVEHVAVEPDGDGRRKQVACRCTADGYVKPPARATRPPAGLESLERFGAVS